MATYNTNRAAFVQHEYRYAMRSAPEVFAENNAATVVEVVTNLDEVSAEALAGKYLVGSDSPRAFEIVLEGVTDLTRFVGGVPAFLLNLPKYNTDGRTYKVMGFTVDYDANTTTLQVRG